MVVQKKEDDLLLCKESLDGFYKQKLPSSNRLRGFINDVMHLTESKSVLEIGCGPHYGLLPYFWTAKERIVIEPLMDKFVLLWDNEKKDLLDSIVTKKFSIGADVFLPELAGKIDGLVIVNNSLDHTPNWMFVLSNISSYSLPGCYLYIWTDIFHSLKPNVGHYNITPDINSFLRVIENLGYKILKYRTNKPLEREEIFCELTAVKQ